MSRRMAWVENGVVANWVMADPAQAAAFGPAVRLVDPGDVDVWLGDAWDGKAFYRSGVQLEGEEDAP